MALDPVPMSARELSQILSGMAELTGARHSFEGNLTYSAMDGPPCTLCHGDPAVSQDCERCEGYGEPLPEGMDFWVTGVIRDNSDGGQGFVTVVGRMLGPDGQPIGDLS